MEFVEQHLHGSYFVKKGQFVKRGQAIGYIGGNGAGVRLAPHDHVSVAIWDGFNHANYGWFGPTPNKLINPWKVGVVINGDKNNKWVFDQSQNLGGYNFLEQTPYNWYTGENKSLHDGLDLWGTIGQFVYALNDGVVTDVGSQSNGLTYVYIK